MIDIFDKKHVDLTKLVCHSGGADGSDTFFENIGKEYGVKTMAYSYKTKYHESESKIEISEDDYNDGIIEINRANRFLGRFGIHKYMNLLARNWVQVKYSDQIFAIGIIVDPGKKGSLGYYSKAKYQSVDGGTGYACMCAINNNKPLYVFDQNKIKWFRWSYISMSFVEFKEDLRIEVENFAGIGTRKINNNGIKAIEDLYRNTFNFNL